MKTRRLAGGGKAARSVTCAECGQPVAVAAKAMSVFCPHCSRRVVIEDRQITGYYASRDLAVAGDIVVEPAGNVIAPIKATNLTVAGEVRGTVRVWGVVEITRTGRLRGDVTTARFVIRDGGTYEGFCRIGVRPDEAESGKRKPKPRRHHPAVARKPAAPES